MLLHKLFDFVRSPVGAGSLAPLVDRCDASRSHLGDNVLHTFLGDAVDAAEGILANHHVL